MERKHSRRAGTRSQSATEYLMTYGWAILIVGVVIASLYGLGVFGGGANVPNACLAVTSYICTNPVLYASGTLEAGMGQVSSGPITVTGTACTRNATIYGILPTENITLQSDSSQQILFRCPLSDNAVGSRFNGFLWIEYTNQYGQRNIIDEVAKVSASVVSPNALAYAPTAYIRADGGVIGINLATYSIVNTISINNFYFMAMNTGDYAYGVGNGAGSLYKINLADYTSSAVSSLDLPSVGGLVLSPGGGYAYVVEDTTPGNFITIDLSNGIVTNTISLPDCQGLTPAVSPDGKYAYVTNCDTLYVINLATDTVTNSFPISYGSVATIAVSPDGQYVYTLSITCGGSYMDTIDLGNGAVSVTAHPSWGGCSGAMALSPDGHDAYLMVGDELVRVNLLNGVVSNVISGYVTQSIAVSNDGRYAYLVQDNNPGGLVTVDLESDQVTNTIYFPWVGYFNYPNYIAVYTPPSP